MSARWRPALLLAFALACCTREKPTPATPPPRDEGAGEEHAEAPQAAAHEALDPDSLAALQRAGIPPRAIACSGEQTWDPELRGRAKALARDLVEDVRKAGLDVPKASREALYDRFVERVFWRMVRETIVEGGQHNLGAVALKGRKTADGKPLVVFRTGLTAAPNEDGSCVDSLVEQGVRHIVDLYAGPIPTADLSEGEEERVQGAGGTYYSARGTGGDASHWRDLLRDADKADAAGTDGAATRLRASQALAQIIRTQILEPGGAAPRGHVQVHCGGGMHRTGMLMGVLERCVNGAQPEVIERHYKRHVGWRSDAEPGGFEDENLRFIAGFDCGLLGLGDAAATQPAKP